jgi:V-type H+-transporting ATPase subunit H
MSLDPPTYLSSLQNNIRARPIPWDGAVRAGHITDGDLKKIKSVDKVRREQRKQTVEANLEDYVKLLLGGKNMKSVLETAGKRADVVQYILVLAGDMIDGEFKALNSINHAADSRCFYRYSSTHIQTLNAP